MKEPMKEMSFKTKEKKCWDLFYKNVKPIKITQASSLTYQYEKWGLLTDFYLESVKINNFKGEMSSTATLKVGDTSGHIICVVKGTDIGLLFDLTPQEWEEVEKLNSWGDQLFYRYFKNGIKNTFNYEQKLFYNFCMSNQTSKVLAVVFRRINNIRNIDRNDAVLEILDIRQCDELLLDLYIGHLHKL